MGQHYSIYITDTVWISFFSDSPNLQNEQKKGHQ